MSVTQRRVTADDIRGMDSCIRGLALALSYAENDDPSGLTYLRNEIEAATEMWEFIRGPMPPANEETA